MFQGTAKSYWSKILDPKLLSYKTLTVGTNDTKVLIISNVDTSRFCAAVYRSRIIVKGPRIHISKILRF